MASSAVRATVSGWSGCSFFQRARQALQGVSVLTPSLTVEVVEHPTRDEYRTWWFAHREPFGLKAQGHASSPAVWLNEKDVRRPPPPPPPRRSPLPPAVKPRAAVRARPCALPCRAPP